MSVIIKKGLNTSDKLFLDLEKARYQGDAEVKRASLVRWYKRKGKLTIAQQGLAFGLLRGDRKSKSAKPCKEEKLYLYAISDGQSVKIGLSNDVKRRRSGLQTSCPRKLEIKWQFFVGYDRAEAMKQEKKLHRYCRKHRLGGEWFKPDCLTLIQTFHIRESFKRAEEEKLPAHLIDNISQYQ